VTGRSASTDDHVLAAQLATEAGDLLLQVRVEGLRGKDLKDEGDRRANELLLARLAEHRPDDAVLSEESADSPARLATDRVWIIDPLDGTREFSEGDRTDWAVHVALVERGRLAAGAVAACRTGRSSTGRRCSSGAAQVAGEDVVVGELDGFAGEGDPSPIHEVGVVGLGEGPVHVLLHQQQGDAAGGEAAEELEDLLDDEGGEAHGDLVEEDDPRLGGYARASASICCSPPLMVPAV